MPTQEHVDTDARKGLNSARIRYMTLSLILIVEHAGGFQLSNEIQFFGLKLAEAQRPDLLYTLLWITLLWLTFVYWQHYRKSPDRSKERPSVTDGVKHGALQGWQAFNAYPDGKPYREIKVSPDLRSARVSASDDPDGPVEEHEIPADIVKRARWRARKALILYEPETIALRLPFVLAAFAVLTAILDRYVL